EAREFRTAVERIGPRMRSPVDQEWFTGLLAHAPATSVPASGDALNPVRAAEPGTGSVERTQDRGEAPDTTSFVGRAEELALLRQWVLDERCRLVAVLGFGGIGKTILAARMAQAVAPGLERVAWGSC